MAKFRWAVWVGKKPTYFCYKEDAKDYFDSWNEQGYEDISIEFIGENNG